jgi:hypothetical protein
VLQTIDDQIWQEYVISDILDGYFHRIPEPWLWFHARYIQPMVDISNVSDISDLQSGSRALALAPGRIYSTQGGYI